MTVTIAMPQLGLTMTEATVSAWLKKPGDPVKKDEALLSITTDKVDMDVESNVDGVLRDILVEEGKTVPVGTPLALVDGIGKESPARSVSNLSSPPPVVAPSSPPPASQIDIAIEKDIAFETDDAFEKGDANLNLRLAPRSSPRARRQARRLGVDLVTVQGTGPGGRIVEKDLLDLAPPPEPPRTEPPRPATPSPQTDTKRRQLIADSMTESVRTIPAFSVSLEVDAHRLVSLYRDLSQPMNQSAGAKLTYTDLLFRALALSLAGTAMNAVWEGEVRPRSQVILGLAVATDRGVVAPVLADADRLPLPQLITRRSALTDKARQGRLSFADLEGAVGTFSNLGMYRVDRFEGIITPRQTFILAAGKLRERPWVEDKALTVRPTVILNLSVDHRVADGAVAAAFLERIAEAIENPYRLLWNE
jgi:pyruvate dehydrogenase E2 component (dihydrolipoamide acetyltransferase)